MADNRQFTDHNEIGGVNVYLEDKKLAESPEKNTVASTDYVLLKDTDDIPHKISKANFVEAVRDALGTVLADQDNGANIGLVPTLNSTGNTFGSSSLANFASVLGVEPSFFKVISKGTAGLSTEEFNSLENKKLYLIVDSADGTYSHLFFGMKNNNGNGSFLRFDYGASNQLILYVWIGNVVKSYTVSLTEMT